VLRGWDDETARHAREEDVKVARQRHRRAAFVVVASSLALSLGLAGFAASPAPDTRSPLARLGEEIFHDASLSASGRMACATCHDATRAFAGADGLAVPMGGPELTTPGLRNAPSLKYLAFNPAFAVDAKGVPSGGMDRDGRAADFAEQARGPLLTAFEMGNPSALAVVAKMKDATYAGSFRKLFGEQSFDDPVQALEHALLAVAQYEREDTATFAPFNSKYDFYLAGKAELSAQELRGLRLFEDPDNGNCAACHPSRPAADGTPPLFTDFTYDNVGVPRNPDIPANADPGYFDLGACGPLRTDVSARHDLCGAFKVPTLRNIALTAPYFHNGRFGTLREVVEFYVRRDTNPEQWYPTGSDGLVHKFDDVPPEYAGNVNTDEGPYDRHPGEAPALSDREIDDVVAFLQTLTDDYKPQRQ
jgi:cytochrome c peroxidase